MKEGRDIHPHEAEQRAEVEQLGAQVVTLLIIVQHKRPDQRDGADEIILLLGMRVRG